MLVPDFSVVKLARKSAYKLDGDLMARAPGKTTRIKSSATKMSTPAGRPVKTKAARARTKG